MAAVDDLLLGFELHDPDLIRAALAAGAGAASLIERARPVDLLVEMYLRSDRFADCLRVLLDAGADLADPRLEAILLDDADALRVVLERDPDAGRQSLDLRCAATSLRGVPPLHVCAEYNSLRCAELLLERGVDVDARAAVDADGVGGHSALFHTVNSSNDHCRPAMELLVETGADVALRVDALVWGAGFDWETVVIDVTPLSYAQCGLYAQFHRDERRVYANVDYLHRRRYGRAAPTRNVPNRYLQDDRVFPPRR